MKMAAMIAKSKRLLNGLNIGRCQVQDFGGPLRCFYTAPNVYGPDRGLDPIKNFTDFKWPNKVTTFEHYKMPQDLLDHEFNYPICRDTMGIRWPGYWFKRKFVYVKEMEPELVVPDLNGFELKPYVDYAVEDIDTKQFTAKQLFDSVYAPAIKNVFEESGTETFEVSSENIDEARLKALQTGADLFEEHNIDGVRAPMDYQVDL